MSEDEFGLAGGGEFAAFSQRLYLHADLRAEQGQRLFLQLVAGDEDGRKPGPRSIDETEPDIAQAFADVPIGDVTFRVGRQEVTIDNNRLIAIRDAFIRRTFDGVRIDAPLWDDAAITAFWLRPVAIAPEAFDDRSSAAETFVGVDLNFTLDQTGALHLYAFERERERANWASISGSEQRRSYGARWIWREGAYDATTQATYQNGEIGAQSIEAVGATFDAGVRLDEAWSPRLGVTLGYASGDRDRNDATLNTFDPLYPVIAILTEAPVYFPANLSHAGARITVSPSTHLTLDLEVLRFARAASADAIYSSTGGVLVSAPQGDLASSNVVVANALWTPSANFDAQLQVVHATSLGGLERAGGQDMNYVLFQMSVHF